MDGEFEQAYFGRLVRSTLEAPLACPSHHVMFTRSQIVEGIARGLIKTFDVKKREYFGNTSMEAEISLLMANQTQVCPPLVNTTERAAQAVVGCAWKDHVRPLYRNGKHGLRVYFSYVLATRSPRSLECRRPRILEHTYTGLTLTVGKCAEKVECPGLDTIPV